MPSFAMPNVGEGVTEGEVTRWLKVAGDFVARDEPVVEIETDKAVVEVPSPFEGTLSRILVAVGQVVPVGTPLAEIEEAGAPAAAPPAPPAEGAGAAPEPPPPPPPEPAPSLQPARAEAAPAEPVAAPLPPQVEPPPPPPPIAPAAPAPAAPTAAPHYSPAVLKLAAQHGIDLARVPGSGMGGRVTRKDVLRFLEHSEAAAVAAPPTPTPAPGPAPPPPAAPPPAAAPRPGEGEPVPLSATRRAIARHMTESHATIPVAWMAVEANVSGLVELRRRVRAEFEQAHGLRLTYMPFFVRAIVETLQEHPALNASYSEDGVVRHARLDMGIAVATDAGLLVPVLREADRKSLPELARELQDLAERARARTLAHAELVGATLTIDNTGAFGSLISQPLVPLGQAAIVTTEAIRRELRLVGDGDTFGPRSVMHLAISFDHRALDGAEVGEFMAALKERLEAIGPDEPLD